MPMIIINTNDVACTVREQLIKAIDRSFDTAITGQPKVDLAALAQPMIDAIVECGNQTPAEKPIELVQAILDRWGILRWSPNERGKLIGELVRACLGIDSPNLDEPMSTGECPTDES